MSEVLNLEQQVLAAKDLVERRQMAIKLSGNREFRKLILDDYCVTEAARLVQMSSDPAMTPQQRADALDMAQATGHMKRYLSMMVQMGYVAERELHDLEEALVEARQEEADEAVAEADDRGPEA